MVIPRLDIEKMANHLEKSLDMFGVDDAFKFFNTSKEQWIKEEKCSTGIRDWNDPIYVSPGTYMFPPHPKS